MKYLFKPFFMEYIIAFCVLAFDIVFRQFVQYWVNTIFQFSLLYIAIRFIVIPFGAQLNEKLRIVMVCKLKDNCQGNESDNKQIGNSIPEIGGMLEGLGSVINSQEINGQHSNNCGYYATNKDTHIKRIIKRLVMLCQLK